MKLNKTNFLISRTLIEEFLSSAEHNRAVRLYVNPKNQYLPHIRKIIKLAKEKGIPINVTDFPKFNYLTKEKNIPLILEISSFRYSKIEEIERNKTLLEVILFVYKVRDPRNLGAILRTSKAFDIKGIILTSKDSCPINDTVINTSRNSLLPIARVNNSLKIIEYFRTRKYEIILLDVKGETNLYTLKEKEVGNKLLIVLGGEKGINPQIKNYCKTIRIPIHNVESLNTSVALGIALSHIYYLRTHKRG